MTSHDLPMTFHDLPASPAAEQVVITANCIERAATRKALEAAMGRGAAAPTGVGPSKPSTHTTPSATPSAAPAPPRLNSSTVSAVLGDAQHGVFMLGAPPYTALSSSRPVLVLRIGNTHHDEQVWVGGGDCHRCAIEPAADCSSSCHRFRSPTRSPPARQPLATPTLLPPTRHRLATPIRHPAMLSRTGDARAARWSRPPPLVRLRGATLGRQG